MLKQRWAQALVAVVSALLAVGILRVAETWVMFGSSPYVQYLKWVHHDIPRFTIPVRLVEGTPVTFQARIIRRYGHELNLLVYFGNKKERTVVEDLIGEPVSQPRDAPRLPSRLPTTVSVTVRDQDQRIVYDQTRRSDGRIGTASHFLQRQIALLPPLDEGLYTVSVTTLSDVSALAPFRTELELTYLLK